MNKEIEIEKKRRQNKKTDRYFLIFGFSLLFASIISPLLFTGYFFNSSIDFSNTGEIGDTISGLTAPFIGVFGGILVYVSFRKQVEANEELIESNKLLKNNTQKEYYFNLYKEIDNLLNLCYLQIEEFANNKEFEQIDKNEIYYVMFLGKSKKQKIEKPIENDIIKCRHTLRLFDVTTKTFETLEDWEQEDFKNILRTKILCYHEMYFEPITKEIKEYANKFLKIERDKSIQEALLNIAKERKIQKKETLDNSFSNIISSLSERKKAYYRSIWNSEALKFVYNIEVTLDKNNCKFYGKRFSDN